jgi:hypothetical protein
MTCLIWKWSDLYQNGPTSIRGRKTSSPGGQTGRKVDLKKSRRRYFQGHTTLVKQRHLIYNIKSATERVYGWLREIGLVVGAGMWWGAMDRKHAHWCESIAPYFTHDEAIRELKRLNRSKCGLRTIKRTLTKPIPCGGWNAEHVHLNEHIRYIEARILVLREIYAF